MAVSQQEIESWLWEAANILRGPVDPANLRDFVFPLLFLKRLSDTWDEEQDKAVAEFGKNVDEETAADFHKFVIPKGCHWADLRRVAENHGVALLKMMQRIEEANPALRPDRQHWKSFNDSRNVYNAASEIRSPTKYGDHSRSVSRCCAFPESRVPQKASNF